MVVMRTLLMTTNDLPHTLADVGAARHRFAPSKGFGIGIRMNNDIASQSQSGGNHTIFAHQGNARVNLIGHLFARRIIVPHADLHAFSNDDFFFYFSAIHNGALLNHRVVEQNTVAYDRAFGNVDAR